MLPGGVLEYFITSKTVAKQPLTGETHGTKNN